MIEPLLRHGKAHQSAALARHEVDRLGRYLFGGERQVTFVLAIFIVYHHDHAPRAKVGERRRNVGKERIGWHAAPMVPSAGANSALHGRWARGCGWLGRPPRAYSGRARGRWG